MGSVDTKVLRFLLFSLVSFFFKHILALFVVAFSHDCRVKFPEAGLSNRYNESIAHAIHSMTLDVVQRFQPNAGLDNKVPTVNMNISSAHKVPFNHSFAVTRTS